MVFLYDVHLYCYTTMSTIKQENKTKIDDEIEKKRGISKYKLKWTINEMILNWCTIENEREQGCGNVLYNRALFKLQVCGC